MNPMDPHGVNDLMDTISKFEGRIALAQMQGEEWVEADEKVIDTIMKMKPWKDPGYIIYKGIKVCPVGKRDTIEEQEAQKLDQKLHQDRGISETG